MHDKIKLLDVVALTEDLPEDGLYRGQVGTVVEVHKQDAFEVEFVESLTGRTYALVPVRASQLMLLHHAPIEKN